MTNPARATLGTALSGLPASCPPGGRGWSAALACLLEATAPKPGNVHPAASFSDLAYVDLVAAALAIAPAMERAPTSPLGRTILDAVSAARAVTRSNANLGIVLVIAPLAAAPERTGGARGIPLSGVEEILAGLTPADAADVWQAIGMARPGGMGASSRWDLTGPPPDDLRAAMRHAATRAPADEIARLWADGYGSLVDGAVRDLASELHASRNPVGGIHPRSTAAGGPRHPTSTGGLLFDAIVRCHLRQLARAPDTLIARRHGGDVARDVSQRAAAVLAKPGDGWRAAAAEFDRHLRTGRRLNPGTTADLVAGALYIVLREGRLMVPLELEIPHTP